MTSDRPSHLLAAALPHATRRHAIVALASAASFPAFAQFRVEITGVGLTQLPTAIAPFRGEAGAPQKISAIVQADLERSGQFRAVDASGPQLDENSRPDVALWKQKGADSLTTGSLTRLPDGRYDVRFRLWETVRGEDLGGQSFVVTQADLRLVAHRIADYVYEKLTGQRGIFSTRIAYVTKAGSRYSLWVADATARTPSRRSPAPSPSSRRPGRPPARNSPTCHSSRASPWCTCTTSRPVAPPDRQLPRLQQRASLVAGRPHARRHLEPRRQLAALHHRRQRRRAAPAHAELGHRHRADLFQ